MTTSPDDPVQRELRRFVSGTPGPAEPNIIDEICNIPMERWERLGRVLREDAERTAREHNNA